MTSEFIDLTGSAPGWSDGATVVPGTWLAVYVTGSGGVPETAAELAAARAKGVNLITIDQQPGLPLFRIGQADVADIENGAATVADFAPAVAERRTNDIQHSTSYCSESLLAQVEAAISGADIWRWVADYSWSANQSIQLLAAHADWGATQFGDPGSNPYTVCPGTGITLPMANADIDMGADAWLALFKSAAPTPPPVPAPPPPSAGPAWPFGPYDYLGTPRSDAHCHSGYYSIADAHVVAVWQQRMKDRGWTISVDGHYGINEATLNQGQSPAVCHAFQQEKGLSADYLVGPKTWAAAWTAPITP